MAAVSVTDTNGFENLLDNISFSLNQGDRLGIMGPSGAGKTTLLRLLNRLIEPSQGTIFFAEKSFLEWPVIALRRQIVLVPQEPKLLGMTVQESLAYPLKLQSLSTDEIQTRISQISDRLQIPDDWLERNELQLSLGQRQLVTIARGILMEPKILLLDEPTSALDRERSQQLIQVLNELSQTGMTIIMVNHQEIFINLFRDKLLQLEQGKLV